MTPARKQTDRRMPRSFRGGAKRGFALIETMVGLTVFALALTGLAPLMVSTAKRSAQTPRVALRNALVAEDARRLAVTAYASLAAGTTCTQTTDAALPNTECVTVSQLTSNLKLVTLVMTPSAGTLVRADTVLIERVNPALAYNPLNNASSSGSGSSGHSGSGHDE